MSSTRSLLRSFAGGEITPEMFGRLDLTAFQTGLAKCRNFLTLPHGPAANRPGFEFVRAVKDSTKRTRLIPFSFSTTQTFVIELGHQYIRFHTNGATLLSGGVPYEVATPYVEADLFDIHYVQSADVLTLVHQNYAPRELRRLGPTNWTLTTINFLPTIATPGTPTVTASGGGGIIHTYVTTALAADGLEESLPSPSGSVSNDLTTAGNFNHVAPAAVAGAVRYNIYKLSNGLYGYIGQTDGSPFKDDNVTPDISQTPPQLSNPFGSAGNYPSTVSYFEQRRLFSGTTNKPQNTWMTRSGTESNLSSSIPTRDDDAIAFRIAAREANTIRHIVPLSDLILLTSSAEWRVTSSDGGAIKATSIYARAQTFIGANNVQPPVVNNSLLYAAAKGGRVRELVYTQTQNGYGYLNNDISMLAPHLFDFKTIVDMAFAHSPYPMLWAVSSDGRLLGMTYVPEQKVSGWHQHDTDGTFESVAAVTEGEEDALYAVVKRHVNGVDVRYVERLHSRQFETLADAFFVDCGLTYSGAPATTISGLDHLEGKTVSILADGAVHPQQVVTGGAITLEQEASKVHIGLPITADLQTLPVTIEASVAFGQGRVKNINQVWIRVYRSSGVFVGPSEDKLREYKQRRDEPYGSPPDLVESDDINVTVDGDWNNNGHVFARQSNPLPLTVASLTAEVAVGG